MLKNKKKILYSFSEKEAGSKFFLQQIRHSEGSGGVALVPALPSELGEIHLDVK